MLPAKGLRAPTDQVNPFSHTIVKSDTRKKYFPAMNRRIKGKEKKGHGEWEENITSGKDGNAMLITNGSGRFYWVRGYAVNGTAASDVVMTFALSTRID